MLKRTEYWEEGRVGGLVGELITELFSLRSADSEKCLLTRACSTFSAQGEPQGNAQEPGGRREP